MYTFFFSAQSNQLSVLMLYLNPVHGGEREKKYLKLKLTG